MDVFEIMILALVGGASGLVAGVFERVSRLERKIDLLLEGAEIDVRAVARGRARELLSKARRKQAIKEFQALTGARSAEAEAAIAELESDSSHRYEGSRSQGA